MIKKKVKCERCGAVATAYSRMSEMFVCDYCLLDDFLNGYPEANLLPSGGIEENEKEKYAF